MTALFDKKEAVSVIRWLFGLFIGASFTASLFAQSPEMTPDALVKKVTEDTLAIVRSDSDIRAGNRKKIIDLVETKILPYFDFTRMTRLAMGKNWRQANSQQQQTLVSEFRTLLVNTYASAFTTYKDQTVDIKPLRMESGDTDVVVRTVVNQQNGQSPVTIDYNMEKTDTGWKVYDFTVEGVRWVQNYRNTFNNEVQNGGVDGLIKTLQDKNRSLAQAPGK
jgi:phospholipid transport system substrate-binding protein